MTHYVMADIFIKQSLILIDELFYTHIASNPWLLIFLKKEDETVQQKKKTLNLFCYVCQQLNEEM